jgi:hypothetical protein
VTASLLSWYCVRANKLTMPNTATSPKDLHQLFTKGRRFATLSLNKPTVRVPAEKITAAVEFAVWKCTRLSSSPVTALVRR